MALYSCADNTDANADENLTEVNESEAPIDDVEEEIVSAPDPIVTPDGYEILGEAEGDLNKDGSLEKVIVYNTKRDGEMGSEREVRVYKIENNQWTVWEKSTTAVLSSESGGMMGDPFESVAIERGCVVLNHYGGSRWRWNYTHRYRFQNNKFQLIGATSGNGAECEYWEELDYNISSGQATFKKETERCNDDGSKPVTKVTENEKFTKKLSPLPSLSKFSPGSTEIAIPKRADAYYY
jgi:hypothetical protein